MPEHKQQCPNNTIQTSVNYFEWNGIYLHKHMQIKSERRMESEGVEKRVKTNLRIFFATQNPQS